MRADYKIPFNLNNLWLKNFAALRLCEQFSLADLNRSF